MIISLRILKKLIKPENLEKPEKKIKIKNRLHKADLNVQIRALAYTFGLPTAACFPEQRASIIEVAPETVTFRGDVGDVLLRFSTYAV
jgi:hypothetical protein